MKARMFAYQALCKICLEKIYSNLYLRKELNQVDQKDKALCTQIIYGTLQNYRLSRYQWEDLVKKMPKDKICILLDMSIYQLFYMDHLPSYAIVNEAVEIAKKQGGHKQGAFVNAILHKAMKRQQRKLPEDVIQKLALETSHPEWLVRMWKAQYGFNICEKICRSNMNTPQMCARVNLMKISREKLLEKEPLFKQGKACPSAIYYQGSDLVNTSYYQDGLISIQDEASQMVAYCLNPNPNDKILDVCAAPGTKTCHIAELMKDNGEIICGDIHKHRVELIKQGMNRLHLTSIFPKVMDATVLEGLEEESFDRVLCDVPCSGYGVLGRKSDIKYHMESSDMDAIIPIQASILNKASQMVKKYGILVYSTCTLNKKENEKQIEVFIKEHPNFEVLQQETIFPFTYESDGFFMAKLKRIQ